MEVSHHDMTFDEVKRSVYAWCFHCERTYEWGKWRNENGLQMCPYRDCNGDAVIDAWDWETVRDDNPQYPVVPEVGKHYSLYPDPKELD